MTLINDKNFKEEIQKTNKPVLVDFFADWCGPCKMLAPILEKAIEEFEGDVELKKINVDNIPSIAQEMGIEKIPFVVLFKEGKPQKSFVGLKQEKEIKEWLMEGIIDWYKKYAEKKGFKINPDKKITKEIVKGLLKKEQKHGERYCPCRREKDEKNICPCFFHEEEIKKDGKCFCGLFIK